METLHSNRKVQYLAGVSASLAFVFTGAALSWPSPALPKFKNHETQVDITEAQCSWLVALVTVGAIPGCAMAQVLVDKIGRKRTIFTSAAPALFGCCIILLTRTPALLYLARFLQGCSTGMTAVVTMIYLTEIADKQIRGALGMLVQVMGNVGSLLMYCVGPFVTYTALNALLLSVPCAYAAACCWLPESPYYLLSVGRDHDARREFMKLQHIEDSKLVDDELAAMRAHVRHSMSNKSSMRELFGRKQYRRAIGIITGLKVLQYMTGSLAIQSYLETIFRHSSTAISGPLASIIYGVVQLAAGLVATLLADRAGRRPLMMTSSLGVGLSLTAVGLFFYLQDYMHLSPSSLTLAAPLPLAGILGFNVFYAIGIGNLPYVMQAELFPINVKSSASSAATILACIFSFTVAKSYQGMKESFGLYTVFWIFAAVAYAGVLFIFYIVPETKGRSLEEVQIELQGFTKEAEPLRGKNRSEVEQSEIMS